MPNMSRPNFVQEQPQQAQQQKGVLGNLFSVFQAVAPFLGPEAIMASKVGGALFNPSAQNIGSAISQVAGGMGDSDGDGKSDSMDDKGKQGFVGPMDIGNAAQQAGDATQQAQPGAAQEIRMGEVRPANSDPETEASEEEKQEEEAPTDMFSQMSVRDLFSKYPGLEQMFSSYMV